MEESGRQVALHSRNDLLHFDSFPTRPSHGDRLLRIFTNIHPERERVWVTTDNFGALAGQFADRVGLHQKPGALAACGAVTTRIAARLGLPLKDRPPYDRFMLKIHHAMKEDAAFQQTCRKDRWEFPSGSTWIVFTDGTSHACLSGQYALEQTFTVRRGSLAFPEIAPIAVLEKLAGRPLSRVPRRADTPVGPESNVVFSRQRASRRWRRRRLLRLEQRVEFRAIRLLFGIEPNRLADLCNGAFEVSFCTECRAESLMRPGLVRPRPDRRTQKRDDSVLVAPVPQQGHEVRHGGRVAGFNLEGFPVGGDGSIRIAPDREQVAEDLRLASVTRAACDRIPRRGDGLIDRLQPLFAPLSTQEDCAQAPDVPRLPGSHLDERVKRGDRVLGSSHLIEQVAQVMGRLRSQRPRGGVVTHRFFSPRRQLREDLGQVVVDPDVARVALRGRLEQGDRRRPITGQSERSSELKDAGGRELGDLPILRQGPQGCALTLNVRAARPTMRRGSRLR